MAFGLEYDRKIGKKHGFVVSTSYSYLSYFVTYVQQRGDVSERQNWFFDGYYQYRILDRKKTNVSALLGANFRYGFESVLAYRFGNTFVRDDFDMQDYGFTLGLRANQVIFWNFVLTADLRFTQYLYRYAYHQPRYSSYLYPNHPNSNMFTMQIGFGYQF